VFERLTQNERNENFSEPKTHLDKKRTFQEPRFWSPYVSLEVKIETAEEKIAGVIVLW
jgi:hypothetical protein